MQFKPPGWDQIFWQPVAQGGFYGQAVAWIGEEPDGHQILQITSPRTHIIHLLSLFL